MIAKPARYKTNEILLQVHTYYNAKRLFPQLILCYRINYINKARQCHRLRRTTQGALPTQKSADNHSDGFADRIPLRTQLSV